jgi:hypothetical protein
MTSKMLLVFIVIFSSSAFSAETSGSQKEPVFDSSSGEDLKPPVMTIEIDQKKLSEDLGERERAWAEVVAAHSLTASLILEGNSKEASKAAKKGLESMEKIKRKPASLEEDELSKKDFDQAKEISDSLKEFVENKDRLYEPGKDRNYYYSLEKRAMVINTPVVTTDGSRLETGSGQSVNSETVITAEDLIKALPKK